MAGIRKFFTKMKGTTMESTATQKRIDSLKGKIETFDNQLATLRKDILEKQTLAGVALSEGRDASMIEDDILRCESRCKTIEHAKAKLQTELIEANENLSTAKTTDATNRIKEIRKEVERSANDLEEILKRALTSAQVFEGLLAEAWHINRTDGVPLSPLGTWANHSTAYDRTFHTDCLIDGLLKRFEQYRPKNDA